jgi:hypothetical protein
MNQTAGNLSAAFRHLAGFLGAAFFCAVAAQAAGKEECSLAKTNHDCTLTIDRQYPLAPPTIQMYPGTKLQVVVKNPYPFERYFLDYSSGQLALAPDVASTIVTGLLPNLKNLAEFREASKSRPAAKECTLKAIQDQPVPSHPWDITTELDNFYSGCLNSLAEDARKIYLSLEPAVAPDQHPLGPTTTIPNQESLNEIAKKIDEFYQKELAVSMSITAAADLDKVTVGLTPEQRAMIRNWVAANGLMDAIAKDLKGFAFRIRDLAANPTAGATTGEDKLYVVEDPPVNYAKMVTRQVTYALDALNLLQNSQAAIPDPSKKKTVASITILFGESRWEASAGALISTLAIRSYSLAPVLDAGQNLANQRISLDSLYPTVVPFAAANYRLSNDWKKPRWRMACYWTFAIGINPNTVTTDFGTGPSISWRGIMLSALWHVGHDVRPASGLYKGQLLPPDTTAVATESYFRLDRVALGISVRIPSLTGR